jgi:hypothetical protein
MMAPFIPQGDRARWRIIYDLLVKTETGDTVTYQAMAGALGLHPDRDRQKIQMAMRRAAKEHLENDLRSVAPVPNEGYRIVETPRKLELASKHQARAVRSVRRGRDQIEYADLAGLDDATRTLFEAMAWKFGQQDEMLRRLDVRQKRHERQLKAVVGTQEETAQQLDDLRERLAKLEADRQS